MEDEYAAAYPELYRRHWWWRVREHVVLKTIAESLPGGVERPRILDVGCGAGLLFPRLEAFGSVEGIESDPIALAQAGRWRSHIVAATLDSSFRAQHPYDVILMLDLIEHVDEPLELLRCAKLCASRSGLLIVTTPAFPWLWTTHDELNRHRRRYSQQELRILLRQAGFEVVRSRYMFQSVVLPKLLQRLKEAVVKTRPAVPKIPARPLNAALRAWYLCEDSLLGRLPFGSSIIAVAVAKD